MEALTSIKKYRSEWKYCEDEAQLLSLKERLLAVLAYDDHAGENGMYEIHSEGVLYRYCIKEIFAKSNY